MQSTIWLSIAVVPVAYYYLISITLAGTDMSHDLEHVYELRRQLRQKLPKSPDRSVEFGPKRGPNYDPTIGYEPYWKDGYWVLQPDPEHNGSTTPGPNCPYVICPKPFVEFGKLCGRSKQHEAKTFDNYCELQREDCTGMEDWMIVYRGPCFPRPRPLNWSYFNIQSTAVSYVLWWWSNSPSTIHTTASNKRIFTTKPKTEGSGETTPNALRNVPYLFRRAMRLRHLPTPYRF